MAWAELLNIAVPAALVVAGYLVGRALEKRHYASIRERERALQSVLALSTRYVPEGVHATGGQLVCAGVVVSSDYFKTFVAGFRNLVGGRFRGYETLLDRARREALLRLKAEAARRGSRLIIGVRYRTTHMAGSSTPSVEVMAYGTALECPRTGFQRP